MIAAYGCYQYSMALVTLYTNLGDDGLVHGLGETEVNTIICSYDTHGKVFQVLNKEREKVKNMQKLVTYDLISLFQLPQVRIVIVFEDVVGKKVDKRKIPNGIQCIMYQVLLGINSLLSTKDF